MDPRQASAYMADAFFVRAWQTLYNRKGIIMLGKRIFGEAHPVSQFSFGG